MAPGHGSRGVASRQRGVGCSRGGNRALEGRGDPITPDTAIQDERDLFELGYAARLNRGTGLYFGRRP